MCKSLPAKAAALLAAKEQLRMSPEHTARETTKFIKTSVATTHTSGGAK
jgi:hypothetical protein